MAKCCAKCGETKPREDFGKNKARTDGLAVYCKVCTKQYMATKQYDKERWANFKEVESARNRAYRLQAADRLKPSDRAKAARRRAENPGAIRAHNIARKHGERRATPHWADMNAINAVYAQAKELQAIDGIARHVDHEIPLKHPLVCGLHVPNNLRVLTAEENMRKHNAFAQHG